MATLSAEERTALTARLAKFEARWDEIALGDAVTGVGHSSGAGSRNISYSRADVAKIDAEIRDLRCRLGLTAYARHASHRPIIVGVR